MRFRDCREKISEFEGFIPCKISASAAYLPPTLISNVDIAKASVDSAGFQSEKIFELAEQVYKQTGVCFRRYALQETCTSEVAWKSLQLILYCVEKANIKTLVCATTSPDFPSPATAHSILNLWKQKYPENLSLQSIQGFDVASSCSSFLSALKIAALNAVLKESSVICTAEMKHKSLSLDLRLRSLFGDGSCAYLIEPSFVEAESYSGFVFAEPIVDAEFVNHIQIPMGGTKMPFRAEANKERYLSMQEPKLLYRHTVKRMCEMIEKLWSLRLSLLAKLGIDAKDAPGVVYIHQANSKLLQDVLKKLPSEISMKCLVRMADTGNIVSASMPTLRTRTLNELKSNKCLQHMFFEEFSAVDDKADISFHPQNLGVFSELKTYQERLSDYHNACENFANKYIDLGFLNLDLFVVAGGGFQTLGCLQIYHSGRKK